MPYRNAIAGAKPPAAMSDAARALNKLAVSFVRSFDAKNIRPSPHNKVLIENKA
jgi:hypothetical protein